MKIKDVEKRVGITKVNIRYYEKEGLLSPVRDQENNYREYSEGDVKRLEQIKVLRALGISIADIKELNTGRITLNEVMGRRLEQIYEEEKNLKEIEDVCRSIKWQNLSMEEVNEQILGGSEETWKEQFERIWKEDITKEILQPKQLNRNLALMLSWGYLINVMIALLFGNYFLKYQGNGMKGGIWSKGLLMSTGPDTEAIGWQSGVFDQWNWLILLFVISIFCYIGIYWTSSVRIQAVIFHIEALILTPLVSGIFLLIDNMIKAGRMQEEVNRTVSGIYLAVFWMAMVVYVLLLLLLSKTWDQLFMKARYVFGIAVAYTIIMTVVAGVISGVWITSAIVFLIFTLYLGLSWYHVNGDVPEDGGSRYYAITNASRIMNIGGVLQNMKGKTRGTFVYR